MNNKLVNHLLSIILSCVLGIAFILVIVTAIGDKKDEKKEVESTTGSIVVDFESKEESTVETTTEEETTKVKTKSNKKVAEDVIAGLYGNGEERYKKLEEEGYDPDKIQSIVDKKLAKMTPAPVESNDNPVVNSNNGDVYNYENTGTLNPYVGVVFYNGHKETYYSQRVLPGGGLNIPGRHVAEDGTIRDGDGYICVAADPSYLPYGSIVETSLGMGKVYDSGCDYGIIDIYTDW